MATAGVAFHRFDSALGAVETDIREIALLRETKGLAAADFVPKLHEVLGTRRGGSILRRLVREAEASGKRLVIEFRVSDPVRTART